MNDNSIIYSHPDVYTGKILDIKTDDDQLNNASFLYAAHSKIMVCDSRIVKIVRLCNGFNKLVDIINAIDANPSETKSTIEFLIKKNILSVDQPLLVTSLASDALEAQGKGTFGFWIHITNDCNLRCRYCYIKKDATVMPISQLDAILDSVIVSAIHNNANRLFFKISGGEPLTNFSTVEHLIAYVNKRCSFCGGLQVHFELLTNGTIISNKIIEFIKTNQISLSISLDGVDNSISEPRVFADGKGSSDIVKKNIDTFIKNGIIPRVMVTITSYNIMGLPQLTEYLISKKLSFRFSLEKDCSKSVPDIVNHFPELISTLDKCFNIMESALLAGNLDWHFKFNNIRFGVPRKRSCSAGTHFFAIGTNGEYASCGLGLSQNSCFVEQGNDVISFLQKYYNKFFSKSNIICQDCCWYSCCGNDCPIQSKTSNLNYGLSPYCFILKIIIPKLLKLDALKIYLRCMNKKEEQK